MKATRFSALISGTVLAAAFALPASAATYYGDAVLCYGPLETTPNGTSGTQTYPQTSNTTRFSCRTTATYTLRQLTQQGWKFGQMMPVVHSIVYQSNGIPKTRQRQQLIMTK